MIASLRTLLAAALLAGSSSALAQSGGPPAEIDTLFKSYEGSWKCETTFAPGALGPGSPEMKAKAVVRIKKDFGGFWYRGEYEIKKAKNMPGFKAAFNLGYEPSTKSAVNVTFDSTGAAAIETAAGATPELVTFLGEGYMAGKKVKMRETMTHKTANEVEHTSEVDMGMGFQKMGSDICKK